MIKKIALVLASLSVVGAIALLFVPSAWVVRELVKPLPAVQYHQAHGLWWQGYIRNASIIIRGYRLPVGRVRWQYRWSSLFSSKACIDFNSTEETLKTEGSLCYEFGQQTFVLQHLGVELLAEEFAAVSGLEVSGHFDAYFQTVRFSPQAIESIDGDIAWQKAQWHNGEKWVSLGELLFTLVNQSQQIVVQGSDVDAPIGMNLTAIFDQGRMTSLDGHIEVTATTDPSLLNTLDFFSKAKQGSRYIIRQGLP